jgi:hypothetical protein
LIKFVIQLVNFLDLGPGRPPKVVKVEAIAPESTPKEVLKEFSSESSLSTVMEGQVEDDDDFNLLFRKRPSTPSV